MEISLLEMPRFDNTLELVFKLVFGRILEPIFKLLFNAIELGPRILWYYRLPG